MTSMIDRTVKTLLARFLWCVRLLLLLTRLGGLLLVALVCCCGNYLIVDYFSYTPCKASLKTALHFSTDKIVFVSNRDGNRELYMMSADGGNSVNLTNNPADDRSPVLSPDGKEIAFASNRTGNYQIYVMNLDGTGVRNISNSTENDGVPYLTYYQVPSIRWIKDDNSIIFASGTKPYYDAAPDGAYYSIHPDGSGRKRLQSVTEAMPELSPNKRYIAFVAYEDGTLKRFSSGYPTLWLANADGSNRRPVKGKDFPLFGGFSWSPDGNQIAYSIVGLEIQDAQTNTVKPLPLARNFGPVDTLQWSPDQRYLLLGYKPYVGKDSRDEGYWRYHVYVLDVATSNFCSVTPYAKFDDNEPIWVPGQ